MKTTTVCDLTGASYRQIDHWTTKGYVGPSIVPTKGTGHCREWSTEDAVRVAVMVLLVNVSMAPARAAVIAGRHRQSDDVTAYGFGAATVLVNLNQIREHLTARRDLVA